MFLSGIVPSVSAVRSSAITLEHRFMEIQKKIQEIFLSTKRIILKTFIRKDRLIKIAPEHCFYVTLAGFKQIINSDFIQLVGS